MGNLFTAAGVDRDVRLSNGATGVLCDVLSLAGSATAATPWQRRLILLFCDSGRVGLGMSGFDLADLPWTTGWAGEKDFFGHVIDLAGSRHGWDRLHYAAPAVGQHLVVYRRMLDAFQPRPAIDSPMGDWTVPPPAHEVDLCPRHTVFRGHHGCRLCDVSIQPSDAPTVWELVSSRTERGQLVDREVRQIPEDTLAGLRALLGPDLTAPGVVWIDPCLRDRVEVVAGMPLDPRWDHLLCVAVS